MIFDFQHSILEGSFCTGIRDNSIVYCPRDLHLSQKEGNESEDENEEKSRDTECDEYRKTLSRCEKMSIHS